MSTASTRVPIGTFNVAVTSSGLVQTGIGAMGVFRRELRERGFGFDGVEDAEAIFRSDLLDDVLSQVDEYFRAERREFAMPLDLRGFTPFTRAVLEEVARRVPYGTTATYGEIAERVGAPRAGRAVGSVMARSPISVIIPCHRIIRSGGRLGEYSNTRPAEGRARKLQLLALEGVRLEGT